MNNIETLIEIRSADEKRSSHMKKVQYNLISRFIIETLDQCPRKRMLLTELIERVRQQLDRNFFGDVSWHFLQVKQDMEARKILSIHFTKNRRQVVCKSRLEMGKLINESLTFNN